MKRKIDLVDIAYLALYTFFTMVLIEATLKALS